MTETLPFRFLMAIGDSYCAPPEVTPFPAVLAEEHMSPGSRYENIAVSGQRTERVLDTQVPRAIEEGPDLVAVTGGLNDLFVESPDLAATEANLDAMYGALRDGLGFSATIFTLTYPDVSEFIVGPSGSMRALISKGIDAVNRRIRRAAPRHGVLLVDVDADPLSRRRELFMDDGLHPTEECTRLMAGFVADHLRKAMALR